MTLPTDQSGSRAPFRRLQVLNAFDLIIYASSVRPEKTYWAQPVIDSAKIGSEKSPRMHFYALAKIIRMTDKHPFCFKLQIIQQKALVAVEALVPILRDTGHEASVCKAEALLKAHTGSRLTPTGSTGNLSHS